MILFSQTIPTTSTDEQYTTIIYNPYEQVDFQSVHHYKANLHTHTTQSDGGNSPEDVIYYYHDYGNYDILSITDHDTNTWPWSQWINLTALEPSNSSEYYPDLEMLAISGNEVSYGHHRGSYLNDYDGNGSDYNESFQYIKDHEGFSIFCHPGRYALPTSWYIFYFEIYYNSLIGMEVYNQGDRHPTDRILWDNINKERNPEELIWGFSNDDNHWIYISSFTNYQHFLMNDLNESELRTAMKNGAFYFSYEPDGGNTSNPNYGKANTPSLKNVKVAGDIIQIFGDNDESIEWYDNTTTIISTTNTIDITTLNSNFIRAVLINDNGRTYTQPFGIENLIIEPGKKPPIVNDIPNQLILEGESFDSINLTEYVYDENYNNDEIVWSYIGNIDLHVTIDDNIATITSPNGTWNGEEIIYFVALNPDDLYDSKEVYFNIIEANDDPIIITDDISSALEDTQYYVDYDCVDPDVDDVLTWDLVTDADFLSIVDSSGLLSGNPVNADVGSYFVNVSVDDCNGGVDWSNFSLVVENVNDPPVIVTVDALYALEDEEYGLNYDAEDPDGDSLRWSLITNTSFLDIDRYSGVLSGIPVNCDVGSFYVNVSVSDRQDGEDWSNFTLTVINVNDPPTITTTDDTQIIEDNEYFVDYEAEDPDSNDILTWNLISNAEFLNMNNTSGVLSGIPSNDDVGTFYVNVSVYDDQNGKDDTNFTLLVLSKPVTENPDSSGRLITPNDPVEYEENETIEKDITNTTVSSEKSNEVSNTLFLIIKNELLKKWKNDTIIAGSNQDLNQKRKIQYENYNANSKDLTINQKSNKISEGQLKNVHETDQIEYIIQSYAIILLSIIYGFFSFKKEKQLNIKKLHIHLCIFQKN